MRPISDVHFSGGRPAGTRQTRNHDTVRTRKSTSCSRFNPHANMAEICREYNLEPRTVYGWKEKFLAGGQSSLDGPDASKQSKRYKKEIASLKRIIGKYAVANDALKKAPEGRLE